MFTVDLATPVIFETCVIDTYANTLQKEGCFDLVACSNPRKAEALFKVLLGRPDITPDEVCPRISTSARQLFALQIFQDLSMWT